MAVTAVEASSSRGRRNSTGNSRKGKGSKKSANSSLSLYNHTTNRILEQLKQGTTPWVKPWAVLLPFNGAKHNRYTGINVFNLLDSAEAHGFKNPRWMTWKQISNLGGTVQEEQRKKYTYIYYANKFDAKVKDAEGKVQTDDKNNPLTVRKGYLKAYHVYNVEQTEGLGAEFYTQPASRNTEERLEDIESFISAVGVSVNETSGDSAYFSKGLGELSKKKPKIVLPAFENFNDASEYYATVFHELAHWTGTEEQQKRECYSNYHKDKTQRAEEELVAELTASFLCAYFGIKAHAQDTSYIASWVKLLEDSEHAIFKASRLAQSAADYLLEKAGVVIKGKYTPESTEEA